MIGNIKTLSIVLLALCALFLTSWLWFSELAGGSVGGAMLTLFSRVQPETAPGQNFFAKPARIVTSLGGGRFDIMYNGIDSSDAKRDSDEAISKALESGEYVQPAAGTEAGLERLLEAPCYAYSYAADMPAAVFVASYPQRRSMLTSRVRNFRWVIVRPYDSSDVGVVFLDTDGRAHEFRINDVPLESRISAHIEGLGGDASRLAYTYERGLFIPQAEGYACPQALMENQYMDQGGLLLDYVRRKVDVFFGGGGSKWEDSSAQSLIYSDENTVVRYFPSESLGGLDILEYANYSVIDRRRLTAFSADYNAAVRFVAQDSAVENEFYLAAADDGDSVRVFYFNYALNDLPVTVSAESAERTGQRYPIEITLTNGAVTRYRKLVYRFSEGESQTAGVSYESLLGNLLAEGESPESLPILGAELGYRVDTGSEAALYWSVDLGGTTFSLSAQSRAEQP